MSNIKYYAYTMNDTSEPIIQEPSAWCHTSLLTVDPDMLSKMIRELNVDYLKLTQPKRRGIDAQPQSEETTKLVNGRRLNLNEI